MRAPPGRGDEGCKLRQGQKRKDKLAKSVLVSDADTPKVLRMIPYQ